MVFCTRPTRNMATSSWRSSHLLSYLSHLDGPLNLLYHLQYLLLLLNDSHDLPLLLQRSKYSFLVLQRRRDLSLLDLHVDDARTGRSHLETVLVVDLAKDRLGQSTDFRYGLFGHCPYVYLGTSPDPGCCIKFEVRI